MKLFRRPNRRSYYTRLYHGGKESLVCLHTDNKREAERRLAGIIYERLPDNIRSVATPPETPVGDAWMKYLRSDSAKASTESSLAGKSMVWTAFLRETKVRTLEQITPDVAGSYLRQVAKRATPQTAKRHQSNLSAIWKAVWPARENPWRKVAPLPVIGAKKYRGFSDEEVSRILSACNEEWRRLVLIGLYTGLRLADAVSVSKNAIADGYLVLVPAKTHRSGRAVRIPLHSELAWVRDLEGPACPVILASYRLQRATVVHQFRRILDAAKITGGKTGYHSLRTTFVTRCETAGIPRPLIQSMVGHSAGQMTGHYSEAIATSEMLSRIQTVSKDMKK